MTNLSDNSGEGQPRDQKACRLLVFPDFQQSFGSRSVSSPPRSPGSSWTFCPLLHDLFTSLPLLGVPAEGLEVEGRESSSGNFFPDTLGDSSDGRALLPVDFLATGGFPFCGDLCVAWFLAGMLLGFFFFSFTAKFSSKVPWVKNPELTLSLLVSSSLVLVMFLEAEVAVEGPGKFSSFCAPSFYSSFFQLPGNLLVTDLPLLIDNTLLYSHIDRL